MTDLHTPPRAAWDRLPSTDAGLLILRVFAGLSLALAHGVGKLPPSDGFVAGVVEMGFPLPGFFAWASALAESLGGLLLAIGLLARPAALFIFINMMVASFVRQAGDPFLERELSLLYAAVAAFFVLAGAGRFSLDAILRRRAPEGGHLTARLARAPAHNARPGPGS